MIEARGATVRRGGRVALDGVDLALRPGEVLAVCGPNGAGKSTLFAVLTGELRPDGGAALLDGRPLAGRPAAELARLRAALEQDPAVPLGFAVSELVAFGFAAAPRAAFDPEALVTRAMTAAGVAHLAGRPVERLSGGERARAHFARTLAQLWAGRATGDGGRFLLLDEPAASLDLAHQVAMMRVARAEAEAGAGVLAVLHDLNLAAAFADRVALLAAGRVVAVGPARSVFETARLGAVYGAPIEVEEGPRGGLRILPVFEGAATGHS